MGKMKEFGFRLSDCIYTCRMSDAVILSTFSSRHPHGDAQCSRDWLLEQIRAVKTNPQLYRGLVESPDSLIERD